MFRSLVTTAALFISSLAYSQNNLPLDAFVKKLDQTTQPQVLDVRTPGEWAAGKVKNAHLINIQDPEFLKKAGKLDKEKPLFIYCAVGGRSSQAAQILSKAGFKQIYNLQGAGYKELAKRGK